MLELRTSPHATVAEAAAELGGLRERVDATLQDELGLHAAVAGLHPTAGRGDAELSSHPRYREVAATTRAGGTRACSRAWAPSRCG